MKKNMLTIVIMAMTIINTILLAAIIFAILPTANKTTNLVNKVAELIDLELESNKTEEEVAISDIETYQIPKELTINLKRTDNTNHYALVTVSLSINKLHEDYETIMSVISGHDNEVSEIVDEEFSAYSIDEVNGNKDNIKHNVLTRVQNHFSSDAIFNVSFGNMTMQ
ncbi:MAG TPA: hypothetical protein GXZ21_02870 [Clostridiales bacterium]|nr:hypothetical protein [Clostridiales bacterium]